MPSQRPGWIIALIMLLVICAGTGLVLCGQDGLPGGLW